MTPAAVRVCGAMFDGVSPELAGPTQLAVRHGVIVEVGTSMTPGRRRTDR